MKRVFSYFLVLLCLVTSSLSLASCEHKHTFSNKWTSNDETHWHACNSKTCNEKSDIGEHSWVLESEDGVYSYRCTICNVKKLHNHEMASTWSKNEIFHWKACTKDNCDYVEEEEPHDFKDEIVGDKLVRTCKVCNWESISDKHEDLF